MLVMTQERNDKILVVIRKQKKISFKDLLASSDFWLRSFQIKSKCTAEVGGAEQHITTRPRWIMDGITLGRTLGLSLAYDCHTVTAAKAKATSLRLRSIQWRDPDAEINSTFLHLEIKFTKY